MVWMKALSAIPLMIIPLIIYTVIMLGWGGDIENPYEIFSSPIFKDFHMISGALWTFTLGHLMIVISLFFLFFEIVKATRITAIGMADHALSTIVFIIFLIEFLMVKGAGSSVFFIMTIISLIDVMVGFIVSVAVARRDMNVGAIATPH